MYEWKNDFMFTNNLTCRCTSGYQFFSSKLSLVFEIHELKLKEDNISNKEKDNDFLVI